MLGVQPLAAQRADLELFVRWMQESRRYKPSTVARRTSCRGQPYPILRRVRRARFRIVEG